jgi:hypothetical protein
MVRRLFATAKLLYLYFLYLSHPYKHPLIEKGLRLSNVLRGG